MRSLLVSPLVLVLVVGCGKQPADKPAATPPAAPAAAPAAPAPPPAAPTPTPAAASGVGSALASAKTLEIARTHLGQPADSKRVEADATKIAAFARAVGDAALGTGLRRCPDTIVVTAIAADGATLAELGFCGSGDNLTEGAEATLPGQPRGRLVLADATAVGAMLAP